MLGIVSKGIIIGILVSAPMGPVGMLCVQRTLNKGRLHGLVTGLGATLSDIVYAILTCLGMGVVVTFVEANQAPLQLLGSIVLGVFGYYIYQSNPVRSLRKQQEKKLSFTQDFITAFFLTFSNVLIVLLYIGLFARFGFVLPEHSVWTLAMGIGGIGIGAISWWFFITYIISKLRKWFNIRGIGVMNRIVGFIIVALSILGAVSVIWPSFLNLPMLHIY
ncbi:MAG: LysE family translocator [Parabacteroides sp.]|uniref:LysE family translocator n=1 Tax=Macellibacteroides sp. TaxID=2014584 RepID=UPI003E20A9F7